jgi:hypothetical protein
LKQVKEVQLFQHANVDNKANFHYPDDYSYRLIQASICGAAAEAATKFTIFP